MSSKGSLNIGVKSLSTKHKFGLLSGLCSINPLELPYRILEFQIKKDVDKNKKLREEEFRKRLNSKNTRGGRYE